MAAALLVCSMLALSTTVARAATLVRPRVGAAMGIVPAHGHQLELASGRNLAVVYHGGAVMHGATIHTVFWAPAGYSFDGSPGLFTLGYVALVQQFFADVAHDSGTGQNCGISRAGAAANVCVYG